LHKKKDETDGSERRSAMTKPLPYFESTANWDAEEPDVQWWPERRVVRANDGFDVLDDNDTTVLKRCTTRAEANAHLRKLEEEDELRFFKKESRNA
jgi:hypothetical protein